MEDVRFQTRGVEMRSFSRQRTPEDLYNEQRLLGGVESVEYLGYSPSELFNGSWEPIRRMADNSVIPPEVRWRKIEVSGLEICCAEEPLDVYLDLVNREYSLDDIKVLQLCGATSSNQSFGIQSILSRVRN